MTREQAKGNLIHAIRWNDMPKKEALDMAIKALEQEPSGDCISRQATLDAIIKRLGISGEEYLLEAERAIYQQILAMPSVDIPSAEPKTGHWIMRHRKVNTINYRTGEDVLTGEIHTVKELIRYETDEPYCACCGKRAEDISQDYCGYCGARMSENPTGSKPEISSYYGLKSYVRERSDKE